MTGFLEILGALTRDLVVRFSRHWGTGDRLRGTRREGWSPGCREIRSFP